MRGNTIYLVSKWISILEAQIQAENQIITDYLIVLTLITEWGQGFSCKKEMNRRKKFLLVLSWVTFSYTWLVLILSSESPYSSVLVFRMSTFLLALQTNVKQCWFSPIQSFFAQSKHSTFQGAKTCKAVPLVWQLWLHCEMAPLTSTSIASI